MNIKDNLTQNEQIDFINLKNKSSNSELFAMWVVINLEIDYRGIRETCEETLKSIANDPERFKRFCDNLQRIYTKV